MADFFIFAKLYFIGISSFTTIEKSTLAQLCCLLPSGSKVLSSPNFPKKKNQRKSLLPVKALPACLTRIHMSKHSRKYSITFQSLYEHFDIKNCKGNNAVYIRNHMIWNSYNFQKHMSKLKKSTEILCCRLHHKSHVLKFK